MKNNIYAYPSHDFKKLKTQGAEQMLESVQEKGMTLRDYFAGKALQGFTCNLSHNYSFDDQKHLAFMCYEFADAMLEARDV